MPQQVTTAVENNFTKGLITESTGLNFPENAATDTDNCIYSLIGDVTRREGIDFELNRSFNPITESGKAKNTYKWNNAGGDGNTQIVVTQIGSTLFFYKSSSATIASPLSSQLLASTVDLTVFLPTGSTNNPSLLECQFTDGNGYLFVFHPYLNSFYCSISSNTITPTLINIRIRDFTGSAETSIPDTFRPKTLTNIHQYNLQNQGWSAAPLWNASSQTLISISVGGNAVFKDVPAGLPASVGDPVNINGGIITSLFGTNTVTNLFWIYGVITAYFGNTMQVTVSSFTGTLSTTGTIISEQWYIRPGTSANYTSTWVAAVGNYPSNSDVWWRFKDLTGVFNPGTQLGNVTLSSPAPKGFMVLDAFNQDFTGVSGTPGLGLTTTSLRPKTGCWFQGRIWYAGVDDSKINTGPASNAFYTWTENIYFSQVVVDPTQFGKCYQTNDPTSETLFDLLPTDGGVIQIQGCGSIYKLFPTQNGLIVFAANGIWFITGNQGIGFSANDYTVTNISYIKSISGTSFVNVQGYPYFWNEEGIYMLSPGKTGSIEVTPITVGTILTFYLEIPVASRKYARGDYNPIDYLIQWTFKSTNETGITDRYQFDRILNFNTYNKAFYPYTLPSTSSHIHGINYVASPGGSTAPDPTFKYFASTANQFSFAEEYDPRLVDFFSVDLIGTNYNSFFITGYKIRGQGIKRSQPQYIMMFSRINEEVAGYNIQGIWDYSLDRNSNRFSSQQQVTIAGMTRFGVVFRRHKIRGHGIALQFKITSIDGTPFDLIGWSAIDNTNQGA